jgi:hypothetical protein
MFLMWKSAAANSISIPIGSANWGFNETDEKQKKSWPTPTGQIYNVNISYDPNNYPAWNSVVALGVPIACDRVK